MLNCVWNIWLPDKKGKSWYAKLRKVNQEEIRKSRGIKLWEWGCSALLGQDSGQFTTNSPDVFLNPGIHLQLKYNSINSPHTHFLTLRASLSQVSSLSQLRRSSLPYCLLRVSGAITAKTGHWQRVSTQYWECFVQTFLYSFDFDFDINIDN